MNLSILVAVTFVYLLGRKHGVGIPAVVTILAAIFLCKGADLDMPFELLFSISVIVVSPLLAWLLVGYLLDGFSGENVRLRSLSLICCAVGMWTILRPSIFEHSFKFAILKPDLSLLILDIGSKICQTAGIVAIVIMISILTIELPLAWSSTGITRVNRSATFLRPLFAFGILALSFNLIFSLVVRVMIGEIKF